MQTHTHTHFYLEERGRFALFTKGSQLGNAFVSLVGIRWTVLRDLVLPADEAHRVCLSVRVSHTAPFIIIPRIQSQP